VPTDDATMTNFSSWVIGFFSCITSVATAIVYFPP
jgi:hypothetical protein